MKILVVTLSNLGDVIMTLPVVQSLAHAYPTAELHVITGASGRMVFENDPRVRRVTVYDKKTSLPEKWRFLKGVRAERYDIILDLRMSAIGLLGGAALRNPYLLKSSSKAHRVARHLEALRGIAPVWDKESFLNGSFWQKNTVDVPEGRFIVAAPGSKSDVKKWPAEKYAELLRRLSEEHHCPIVLVGDKNDAADAEKIKRLIQTDAGAAGRVSFLDLTGKTDFAALVSVIRRASLVVTNDSAPLHIADSLKVPTLAIFGPTDPGKYGPRHAGSAAVSRRIFCQPCEKAQCRYDHECLKELEVLQVYAKAVQIMNDALRAENFKILIIRLDRVGDLVLSLPAIGALRRRFPQAKISVMTRPYTKSLLEGHPLVDEVIVYDYEKRGRHSSGIGYFRMLKEVMTRRFDAAVVLHPGIRSYLVPFLCGIPYRIGYRDGNAWLLTQALRDQRREGQKHESRYAMDLAAVLGADPVVDSSSTRLLPVDGIAREKISEIFQENGITPNEKLVAFHPGASCPSKRWPQENFRSLAQKVLEESGCRVVIVGDGGEESTARSIAEGLGSRVLDLAGQLSLRELAALLSRCELLVSNDSGPVHVAAAVGTRVISLFGRNQAGLSVQRWKPLGHGHAVIQKDVGCVVCLAHRCTIGFECMKAIHVEDVLAQFRKMIQKEKIEEVQLEA
jgi:heptosyltransferase-2